MDACWYYMASPEGFMLSATASGRYWFLNERFVVSTWLAGISSGLSL